MRFSKDIAALVRKANVISPLVRACLLAHAREWQQRNCKRVASFNAFSRVFRLFHFSTGVQIKFKSLGTARALCNKTNTGAIDSSFIGWTCPCFYLPPVLGGKQRGSTSPSPKSIRRPHTDNSLQKYGESEVFQLYFLSSAFIWRPVDEARRKAFVLRHSIFRLIYFGATCCQGRIFRFSSACWHDIIWHSC